MIPPMEFRVRKGSLRIYECGYNLHLKRAQTSNFSRKEREKKKSNDYRQQDTHHQLSCVTLSEKKIMIFLKTQ
jgi:hypothetical protein